jgi:hypothetical protein
MKKYCRNCKYRGNWLRNLLDRTEWCEKTENKYTSTKSILLIRKDSLNSDGECKFYKRIWYKFWVKEK